MRERATVREPVVVTRTVASYPREAPFDPSEAYPELPHARPGGDRNPVFAAVRECLRIAGLDADRFGTPGWNPLGR